MNQSRGFTLIEVMIVVAVIGILAAIAYPSYLEYIAKSKRAEAVAALMDGAQALERYYTINGRYTTTSGGTTLASVFPTTVPANGTVYYNVSAQSATSSTFTLRAVPTGSMGSDGCGTFAITHAGERTVTGSKKSVADCWRR